MYVGPAPLRRGDAPLLPHQLEVVGDRRSKIRIVQGGYRSGKTVTGIACVLDMGWRSGGAPILVVEPTYSLIRDVFVRTAEEFLDRWKVPHRYHKGDHILSIGRRKGGRFDVLCKSADRPRSLEGLTVGGALIDEWELCDIVALQVAMARVSVGPCQQVVLTGTPEGFGPGYDMLLANRSEEQLAAEGTRLWIVRTQQNTTLRESYATDMARRMDDEVAAEKLDGVRAAKGGRVYSRFDVARHTKVPCVMPGKGAIQVWADFNIGTMCWLVVEADVDSGRAHIAAEFVGKNTDTAKQAALIKPFLAKYLTETRRRQYSVDDVEQMQIPVWCDASGQQKTTTTPLTNVALLRQAGFVAKHGMKNPHVVDRINTVQVMLRDRKLTLDRAKAPSAFNALNHQTYVKEQPDKSGGLDHAADAIGYGCHWQWPAWRDEDRKRDH